MPGPLRWVSDLVAGQSWPESDEDELRRLGDEWAAAGRELAGLGDGIEAARGRLLAGYGGVGAEQFGEFASRLAGVPGQLAPAATQVGQASAEMADSVVKAKVSILLLLFWTAEEIAELTLSGLGWLAAPEVVAASRLAVARVAGQLARAAAHGMVHQAVVDAGAQLAVDISGGHGGFSWREFAESAGMGALGGLLSGGTHLAAGRVVPRLADSLVGKLVLDAADGLGTGEIISLASGEGQSPGLMAASGAAGAMLGVVHRGRGPAGDEKIPDLNTHDVKVTDLKIPETDVPEADVLQEEAPDTGPPADLNPDQQLPRRDDAGLPGLPSRPTRDTETSAKRETRPRLDDPASAQAPRPPRRTTDDTRHLGQPADSARGPEVTESGLGAGPAGDPDVASEDAPREGGLPDGEFPSVAGPGRVPAPQEPIVGEESLPLPADGGRGFEVSSDRSTGLPPLEGGRVPMAPAAEPRGPARPGPEAARGEGVVREEIGRVPVTPAHALPGMAGHGFEVVPEVGRGHGHEGAGWAGVRPGAVAMFRGEHGRLELGGGKVAELPAGSEGGFDGDGKLFWVRLGGVVHHRMLDGGWSQAGGEDGRGAVVVKAGGPLTVRLADGEQVRFAAGSDLVGDGWTPLVDGERKARAAGLGGSWEGPGALSQRGAVPVAVRGAGRDGVQRTVVFRAGAWRVTEVDESRYQATLAAAGGRMDVAGDYLRLSAEQERFARLTRGQLTDVLLNGPEEDRFAALYDIVRRGREAVGGLPAVRGKAVRWVQAAAARALVEGKSVNMDAGEGKTLVFQIAAVTKALRVRADGEGVLFLTSRDYLADEAERVFSLFRDYGVRVVRVSQHDETPLPSAGVPTVYVASVQEDAFNKLKFARQVPVHVLVDEQDEIMFYATQSFIQSAGPDTPAPALVRAGLQWEDGFAARLGRLDFERREDGGYELSRSGVEKLTRALSAGNVPAARIRGVEEALFARYGLREGTHYVVNRRENRINLIDTVTGRVSADDGRGTGPSRFRGGLHQRLEAKHEVEIRDDAAPADVRELTVGGYFRHESVRSVAGASGTNAGKQEHYEALRPSGGGPGDRGLHVAPRYYVNLSVELDSVMARDRDAKLAEMARLIIARHQAGDATLVLPGDNRDVAGIAAALRDQGFDDFTAADAGWYVEQAALYREARAAQRAAPTADEALAEVIARAGQPGRVTISSMINRGADPAVHEAVLRQGGLGVITDHSPLSPDIDEQAIRRGGRNGEPATYRFVSSPRDDIFDLSRDPRVAIAVYQYSQAAAEEKPEAAAGLAAHGRLAHAGNRLLGLIPALQLEALAARKAGGIARLPVGDAGLPGAGPAAPGLTGGVPRPGTGFFDALHEAAARQGLRPLLTAKGINSAAELRQAVLAAYARGTAAYVEPLHESVRDPGSAALDYWTKHGPRRDTGLAVIAEQRGLAEAAAAVIREDRFHGSRLGALLPLITAQALDLPVTIVVPSPAGAADAVGTALGTPGGSQITIAYDTGRNVWLAAAPPRAGPARQPAGRVLGVGSLAASAAGDPSRVASAPASARSSGLHLDLGAALSMEDHASGPLLKQINDLLARHSERPPTSRRRARAERAAGELVASAGSVVRSSIGRAGESAGATSGELALYTRESDGPAAAAIFNWLTGQLNREITLVRQTAEPASEPGEGKPTSPGSLPGFRLPVTEPLHGAAWRQVRVLGGAVSSEPIIGPLSAGTSSAVVDDTEDRRSIDSIGTDNSVEAASDDETQPLLEWPDGRRRRRSLSDAGRDDTKDRRPIDPIDPDSSVEIASASSDDDETQPLLERPDGRPRTDSFPGVPSGAGRAGVTAQWQQVVVQFREGNVSTGNTVEEESWVQQVQGLARSLVGRLDGADKDPSTPTGQLAIVGFGNGTRNVLARTIAGPQANGGANKGLRRAEAVRGVVLREVLRALKDSRARLSQAEKETLVKPAETEKLVKQAGTETLVEPEKLVEQLVRSAVGRPSFNQRALDEGRQVKVILVPFHVTPLHVTILLRDPDRALGSSPEQNVEALLDKLNSESPGERANEISRELVESIVRDFRAADNAKAVGRDRYLRLSVRPGDQAAAQHVGSQVAVMLNRQVLLVVRGRRDIKICRA